MNSFDPIEKTIKYWFVPLIMGGILVATGIFMLLVPMVTYLSLAGVFALIFFLSGVSDVYFSFKNRELFKGWIWKMVLGLLNAGIGIFLVVHQEISAALLPYVVGFAIALHSLFGLMVSFEMKDVSLQGWGDTAIFSVLGMVLAIAIILNPLFGGLWLVLSTSFAFLTVGSWNLAFALKLRKLNNELFDH